MGPGLDVPSGPWHAAAAAASTCDRGCCEGDGGAAEAVIFEQLAGAWPQRSCLDLGSESVS